MHLNRQKNVDVVCCVLLCFAATLRLAAACLRKRANSESRKQRNYEYCAVDGSQHHVSGDKADQNALRYGEKPLPGWQLPLHHPVHQTVCWCANIVSSQLATMRSVPQKVSVTLAAPLKARTSNARGEGVITPPRSTSETPYGQRCCVGDRCLTPSLTAPLH